MKEEIKRIDALLKLISLISYYNPSLVDSCIDSKSITDSEREIILELSFR